MTDFNKGDFTQQGVDGHVNAKLRLNAKRYLDIDLTSNEQASGCTISGHVYDSLNDITYPIGSAPSGNIEITENTAEGEPLNIAQYATATVNVAGGGLNLLKTVLTLVNESNLPRGLSTSLVTALSGYAVDMYDLDNTQPHYIQGLDTVSTLPTVPAKSSLTINLYYCAETGSILESVGLVSENTSFTGLNNISYLTEYNVYAVTNITTDSAITITIAK